MNRDSIPDSAPPMQTVIPEEDARLLAIEALEARSVDLNPPQPRVAPRPVPVAPHVTAPVTPHIPAPLVGVGVKEPVPASTKKPITPATPAEAIADALANGQSTTKRFQFFTYTKAPRKPFIIIGSIVVLIAIGVGVYFTVR